MKVTIDFMQIAWQPTSKDEGLGVNEMEIYEKMYYRLFNGVTDALAAMEQQNFGTAAQLLRDTQSACEEMLLAAEDETEE